MTFALYLITDPSSARVVEITEAALSAAPPGAIAVQARMKGASARELAELCRALAPICRARGATLLVNDRADVAKVVGAGGVHLPERGLSVAEARMVLGSGALVGRSCHDRAGLEGAEREGADLATLGPIGEVPEKGAPLGISGFQAIVRGLSIPTYALGGVGEADARALRAAGAAGVAVIRAVYGASDPARAVQGLLGSAS